MAVTETVAGWGFVLAVSSVTAAVIINNVMGNYQDSKGQAYGAASNRSSVSVAGVSAATVLPNEKSVDPATDGATHGTVVTKTFTITNDSNISDAFIISALTASGGSIQSVAFTPTGAAAMPVTVGATVSPTVHPGGSITVVVTISTAGAAVGSSIEVALTTKSTAKSQNGPQTDVGKAWIFIARGPQISGIPPAGTSAKAAAAGFPVIELVNGLAVAEGQPGADLSLALTFTNVGDAPALGLNITAQVPPQLRPIAGSAKLLTTDHQTGKSTTADARVAISGNSVTATIPRLDPSIDVAFTYQATMSNAVAIGTTVSNSATIAAQSISDVVATPAIVFVGAMDTVYDGIGGAGHPVGGASVSLVDPASGQKAKLPSSGSAPNATNVNPFSATSGGLFTFALPAMTGNAAVYQLYVTAPTYLNRRIKVAVAAGAAGLPTTTLSALDGLPLAIPGGFSFTSAPVSVAGITGFFGNVPLFAPQALTLSATADRTVASAGDRLGYSIDFGPGNKPLPFAAELTVQLPPGIAYAHGSARLSAGTGEPVIAARTLTWSLKDLAVRRTLTLDTVLLPGVTEGGTLNTHVHLSVTLTGAQLSADTGMAIAVVGGLLSARSILSGRVFANHAKDGFFVPGDVGVPSVRIFLEDGESVLTDPDGLFSFPAARPGMHVLRIDPITLPVGIRIFHGFPVTDPRSSIRLVHGIFDSGLMSDVNFALNDGPAP